MRYLAAFAALSLLAAPAAVQAAKPNEVVLHIETSAQVPPDKVALQLRISANGSTEATARANLTRKEGEVRQHLSELGVDPARIKPGGQVSFQEQAAVCPDYIVDATAADGAAAAAADAAGKPRKKSRVVDCGPDVVVASMTLFVEAENPDAVDRVLTAPLDAEIAGGRRSMTFTQSDPVAARKKARSDALAKARAEADAYAEAMGYKVVRIERVSNAKPAMNMSDLIGFIATIDDRSSRMQPSWFAAIVSESVSIDFVIVPK